MQKARKPKIIVILGPTSSGKSDIAIKLAKKWNGEILSADSRQIYCGLNIGSGKEPGRWNNKKNAFISSGILHYGIDLVSPRTDYNAAKFKKYADKVIADILRRGKLPIVCGGTGFWIKAVVDNISYPEVAPDWKLRNQLRNQPADKLFALLKKLDPDRAKTIDKFNKVRLIRAIEICQKLGTVPRVCHCEGAQRPRQSRDCFASCLSGRQALAMTKKYQFLQIGISLPKEKLHRNIKIRIQKRFEAGMIEEVKKLHQKDKISWKRLESFGLGYKLIPQYLRGEIKTKEEVFEKIFQAEKDYAKRQMTWFRKDKRIVWLEDYWDIEKRTKKFLKNVKRIGLGSGLTTN